MKRKVVKHGSNTMTISIPSKWAKENKIKSGQTLYLKLKENQITISPTENPLDKIEIKLGTEEEWYINRTLRHLYVAGYDDIRVNYLNPEQLKLIRKGIESLTGLEIVESKPDHCVLKNFTPLENVDFFKMVERILWLILSQFDYFIEDCKKGKPRMNNEVIEIHKTITKLNHLSRRVINKKFIYDSVNSKYAYWFLTSLLNIASFLLYSYDYASKDNKLKLTTEEESFVETVRDFYYKLLLAYKNEDVEKTRIFFEEREALFDDVLEILKGDNPIIMHYFLDILKEMSSIGNFILNTGFSKQKNE